MSMTPTILLSKCVVCGRRYAGHNHHCRSRTLARHEALHRAAADADGPDDEPLSFDDRLALGTALARLAGDDDG